MNLLRETIWQCAWWARIGRLTVALAFLSLARGDVRGAGLLEGADIPQFDVFVGFDSTTVEANWVPVVCEVRNEGPTFTATFELSETGAGSDFVQRMPIELPTGTLKRFSFPLYSPSRFGSVYRAVLRDEQGRTIAELNNLAPNNHINWNSILLGAMPASAQGMPGFPRINNRNNVNQAVAHVSRLQPEMFPDNPIALGGMRALYLNSQRAVDLEEKQVEALMSWLHGGGHLILNIDAALDVNGVPWLRGLMPGPLGTLRTIVVGDSLNNWLREGVSKDQGARPSGAYANLQSDPAFDEANIRVLEMDPRGATVSLRAGGLPLIVSAPRERGQLTVLLFNPELEPIRSWRHRPWFWARLLEIPESMATEQQRFSSGGTSVDGVFGAIVDSTQIRKLPVSALLLLLVVYLLVIGPLDQWWLKRINRQMLTWITFPCYVVLFSLLIYYIGYRLRAGESEWNELQIVDVIPKGQGAELRGITYASIYSPVNASYQISGKEPYAALRPESSGSRGVGRGGQAAIAMTGYNFEARVTVPVWTSQTYINSWLDESMPDFTASLRRTTDGFELSIQNRSLPAGSRARFFIGDRVHDVLLPDPGQRATQGIPRQGGSDIRTFAMSASSSFGRAISQRQQALGQDEARFLIDPADAAMAITVGRYLGQQQAQYDQFNQFVGNFMFPGGLNLSHLLDQNRGLLLVYCENYAPTSAMNDFKPIRSHRNALMRLSMALPD